MSFKFHRRDYICYQNLLQDLSLTLPTVYDVIVGAKPSRLWRALFVSFGPVFVDFITMKNLVLLLLLSTTYFGFAQTDTELQNPWNNQDDLIKHRVYSEFGIDMAGLNNGPTIGPRYKIAGNYYFLNRYAYAWGIHCSFFTIGADFLGDRAVHGSLPTIGPSYIIRTKKDEGFEFNLAMGYGGYRTPNLRGSGLSTGIDVKWRKQEFSLGLNYTYYAGNKALGSQPYDILSFNFGWQFSVERFVNFLQILFYSL